MVALRKVSVFVVADHHICILLLSTVSLAWLAAGMHPVNCFSYQQIARYTDGGQVGGCEQLARLQTDISALGWPGNVKVGSWLGRQGT